MGTREQNHYWKELVLLKQHSMLAQELQRSAEIRDKWVKGFLLLMGGGGTVGGVAGWSIWKDLNFKLNTIIDWMPDKEISTWAVILAGSQVLNVIASLLPYQRRIHQGSGTHAQLEELVIEAERHWFEVANGHYQAKEINSLTLDIKDKKRKITSDHFKDNPMPRMPLARWRVKRRVREYFLTYKR